MKLQNKWLLLPFTPVGSTGGNNNHTPKPGRNHSRGFHAPAVVSIFLPHSLKGCTTHRPTAVPLDSWEQNQSGLSMSAFDGVEEAGSLFYDFIEALDSAANMQATCYNNYGSTMTEPVPTGQFQSYGMWSAQENEDTNAEAGPSRLVPYVGPTLSQPSGWIPVTSADAEQNQTFTEEDEATVSEFYRSQLPHVIE